MILEAALPIEKSLLITGGRRLKTLSYLLNIFHAAYSGSNDVIFSWIILQSLGNRRLQLC